MVAFAVGIFGLFFMCFSTFAGSVGACALDAAGLESAMQTRVVELLVIKALGRSVGLVSLYLNCHVE